MSREKAVFDRHARHDERQLAEDVAEVMAMAAGRRIFMAVLTKSGVYRRSEPGRLEYDAGRRDDGLEALHIVNRFARKHAALAADERDETVTAKNSELEAAREQDRKERERT